MIIDIYLDGFLHDCEFRMKAKVKSAKERQKITNTFDLLKEENCYAFDNEMQLDVPDDVFEEWMQYANMTMEYHLEESLTEDYDSLYPWLVKNKKPFHVVWSGIDDYLEEFLEAFENDEDGDLDEFDKKVIEFLKEKTMM